MFRTLNAMHNYLRLGRPYYVIPVIATAIAGYCSGSNTHPLSTNGCIVGFVFFLLGITCWTANEIADRHSDANGKPKKKWGLYVSGGTAILSSGIVSVKSAMVYVVALALAGLLIATLLSAAFWVLSVLFLVIGLAYSVKPARLKDRGILGLAAVSMACGMVAFMAGWVAGGQAPTAECLFFASMLSITFFGFEGLAHLLDHEQDRRNNENTISVSLGQEMARNVLAICQCLPGLALMLLSLLARSAFPHLNLVLIFPLLFICCLIATMTLKCQQDSLTSSLRVFSVPLISVFAFLIV